MGVRVRASSSALMLTTMLFPVASSWRITSALPDAARGRYLAQLS